VASAKQWASLISRDNWHKCGKPRGKRKPYHKKQKYELGSPAANTNIGSRHIHTVCVRGGNKKYCALRPDVGNFSWDSEYCTQKTRIIDVVYNASNNELVFTKTLVKNCIWYKSHYALPLGRKKGKKYDKRKKNAKISSLLEEQFQQGKVLVCITSRRGQSEGKELEFCLRKIKAQKGK
uniref:40S ribosomal protein S8 n=1 Tax=Aotus nancymaae TaxID=37293 RepID=A0A2K5D7A2_AOTNA